MASIGDALNDLKLALSIVNDSTYPTLFTTLGLFLIALSAYCSYVTLRQDASATRAWQKVLLFSSLGCGLLLVGTGGASALLHLFDNPIKRVSAETAINNLGENKKIEWLIRLIPYKPDTEGLLSIAELRALGPVSLKHVFVAPYEELRGYKVADAIGMVGGTLRPDEHVTGIIFRVAQIYPANARGLLQIVQKLERSVTPADSKRLIDQNTFNADEQRNLSDDDAIVSWSWDSYRTYYPHFCKVAQEFRCDKNYASRQFMSALNDDWHPLGFARMKKAHACENRDAVCGYKQDWPEISKGISSDFGSRVFLMNNLEIKDLGSRYLIDFDRPELQVIPDIGPLH